MNKSDRARLICLELEKLYPNPPIPLDHSDEFTLLVAVLLSAQCTDKKVNQVTPELFKLAGTPQQMNQLGENKIYEIIKTLGLSKQKSKHLQNLSERIINTFSGQVPSNFKDLESLAGVGHKTASVVMAQAFKIPTFPVDTHIHRLAQRWGLSNGKSVTTTENDLKSIFPKDKWNKLHLQIIFYGRDYCTGRGCDGTICMLCRKLYPKRKKPVPWIKP